MSNLIFRFNSEISRSNREELLNQRAKLIWFTGLSGSGKSTLASNLESELWELGFKTIFLDGDNVRSGLSSDLDFSESGRVENIRRIGEVSKLFLESGLVVLCAFISPFRTEREKIRHLVGDDNFFEIYVDTPISVCEQRDKKGLYKRARNGEILNFTGVNSPYEKPEAPFLIIQTHNTTMKESINTLKKKIIPLIEK
jgi:adenylylsulfate kinase